MNVLWFALGVLCGVAVFSVVGRRKSSPDGELSGRTARPPTKAWGETRNFLYYDGTVMPEIKEDLHE